MQITDDTSVWDQTFSPDLVDIRKEVWGDWADSIENMILEHESEFSGSISCAITDNGKLYILGNLENGMTSMMSVESKDWAPKHHA